MSTRPSIAISPLCAELRSKKFWFLDRPPRDEGELLDASGAVVKEAVVIKIGDFVSAIISFLIVAFVMFLIIKGMNKLKKAEEAAPAEPPRQEVLLEEIRNLLAKGK